MSLTSLEILSQLSSRDLNAGYDTLAEIPHFSIMKNMIRGATRLADAVRKEEQICCVYDYDADGCTAGSLVISFFKDIGYPIKHICPDRFSDGYGVSQDQERAIVISWVFGVCFCSFSFVDAWYQAELGPECQPLSQALRSWHGRYGLYQDAVGVDIYDIIQASCRSEGDV